MSEGLFDIIPGYREVVMRERQLREEAFLDAPEFICGVEVKRLCLKHLILLSGAKSPFLVGGEIGAVDVALFLWCVSPFYAGAIARRDRRQLDWPRLAEWQFRRTKLRFLKRIRRLPYRALVNGVKAYLDEAFSDSLGSNGSSGAASYYSNACAASSSIAREFGWRHEDIINMPIKCLFQYMRVLVKTYDPGAVLFNPSDKFRGDWLRDNRGGN